MTLKMAQFLVSQETLPVSQFTQYRYTIVSYHAKLAWRHSFPSSCHGFYPEEINIKNFD